MDDNNIQRVEPYYDIKPNYTTKRILTRIRPSDFYGEDVEFDFTVDEILKFCNFGVSLHELVLKMCNHFLKFHYDHPGCVYYVYPGITYQIEEDLRNAIKKIDTKFPF